MPCTHSENPLWALADCNNFYASCEQLFRPDMAGRPLVVLSNNDGCVVARSKEAKALGIPMGEPVFRLKDSLRKHVEIFSSNYALYGDLSSRVMGTLETVCPTVEPYSIDEAFLRLDGSLRANVVELAREARERVRRWTGITVSVGVASTRTLAKIANHAAKKNDTGICVLTGDCAGLLGRVDTEDVWGIGRRQAEKLRRAGIFTALQLRDADDAWLRRHLSVTGWRTALELRGVPCIGEDGAPSPRKTLMCSRSFGMKITDRASLAQAVATYAARAAERLRAARLVAGGLSVTVSTAWFGPGPRYGGTSSTAFVTATADTAIILKAAARCLEGAYRPGYVYAKAGVLLYDLEPANARQGSLLTFQAGDARPEESRRKLLMEALDAINGRFGGGTVFFAAQGPADAPWHMRQRLRSPRMTTRWDEVAEARC